MPTPIHLTPEGVKKYSQEKDLLLTERVSVVAEVQKAREMGDLSENGLYKAAKSRLRFIDSRVEFLTALLKQAKIVEKKESTEVILGSTVTVSNGTATFTYQIVGRFEANPKEGKISVDSPLGKQLLGKREGDVFSFTSPKGIVKYTLIQLS